MGSTCRVDKLYFTESWYIERFSYFLSWVGGWVRVVQIKNKDHYNPAEAETGAKLGKIQRWLSLAQFSSACFHTFFLINLMSSFASSSPIHCKAAYSRCCSACSQLITVCYYYSFLTQMFLERYP